MIPRLIAGAAAPIAGCYDVDILILALDRIEETLAAIASARLRQGFPPMSSFWIRDHSRKRCSVWPPPRGTAAM